MSGEFLKICSEITELYKFGTVEEKQKMINYTLQNFLVEGETLHYEYKTSFNFFALGLNCNKKLPEKFCDATFINSLYSSIVNTSMDFFYKLQGFSECV